VTNAFPAWPLPRDAPQLTTEMPFAFRRDDAESLPTGEQLTGFAGELQQPASFNTVEQPAQVDMNAFQTTTMHDFQAEAAATLPQFFPDVDASTLVGTPSFTMTAEGDNVVARPRMAEAPANPMQAPAAAATETPASDNPFAAAAFMASDSAQLPTPWNGFN